MTQEFDFADIDFITIDTIGDPGDRVFHLQAGEHNRLLTVTIEKEQAAVLAEGIASILEDIYKQFDLETLEPPQMPDMSLREPIIPQFRVGQIGLGYDSENDLMVLMLSELQPEDTVNEQQVARLRITRLQIAMLAQHTRGVIAGGRPICGFCGRPIDPAGHFCPKRNGHKKEQSVA